MIPFVKRTLLVLTVLCLLAKFGAAQGNKSRGGGSSERGPKTGDATGSRRHPRTARNYSVSETLINNLFNGYLDSEPFNNDTSGPLHVKVHARMMRLLEVDELQQVMSFSAKVALEWYDSRLRWTPSQYGNLTRVEVPSSVPLWWPDVSWLERLETDFVWRMQGRVLVDSDGMLTLSSQVIMNLNCYMDPAYFPFDNHQCALTFEPIVHTKEEMVIKTLLTKGANNESLLHDQWTCSVLTPVCTSLLHAYPSESDHVDNKCMLQLKRKALHHIFNLFLPASIITFMTVFAFLIPPTEPDMKIQFSLSILLQLVVFLMYIYDSLPFSDTRIPLLSLYFALCLFLVASCCVLTVVIAHLHWLGEDNIAIPNWLRTLFIEKLGPYLAGAHLKMHQRVKKSSQLAEASSSEDQVDGGKKKRAIGVFRLGRINVPWSVLLSESMRYFRGETAESKAPQTAEPASEPAETSEMLPQDSSKDPGRVRFSVAQDPEHRHAPAAAHPNETLSTALRRTHSRRAPANDQNDATDESEWSLSKVEWSLVALILDRVCAILFVVLFTTLACSILIVGYSNVKK